MQVLGDQSDYVDKKSLEVYAFAPAILLLRVNLTEIFTQVHKSSYAKIATATLFVRAKVGDTINVHQREGVKTFTASSHNMEYHADVKKNEVDF